jgi:hypothetical protein
VDDAAPSTRLECLVNGLPLPTCTPGTLNSATVAGSGDYTLVVRATDAGGNAGEDSHAWKVDLDGPSVAITGAPADPSGPGSAEFTLARSKDVASIRCRLTRPGATPPSSAPAPPRSRTRG